MNIQKIFYGIASGISYLLLHGYYYNDFSISSIIFDKFDCPKLFDYINFDVSNKNYEKNMISRYADILNIIIDKKKNKNSDFSIHPGLQQLIERSKGTTNLPTFDDFIKFFESESYCTNTLFFPVYSKIVKYFLNDFYEDLSLFFPFWKKLFQLYNDKNPFKIYKELIKQIKILEGERNDNIYLINKKDQIEIKIDALKIQAIYFLKEAFKKSNNVKIKIELAVQYINGSILPCNLSKALNILKKNY